MDSQSLRMYYAGRIASNAVRMDPLWQQPCCGYNLLATLKPSTVEPLAAVQRRVLAVEPGLLVCPTATLHVSILSLVAVRAEYVTSKHALWRIHGTEWTGLIRAALEDFDVSAIRYRSVVATDAAVIALAEPIEEVQRLRQHLLDVLRLPGGSPGMPDLVHTTLFRYGRRLQSPRTLLDLLESLDIEIALNVRSYVIAHQSVYPHLEAETVACF